MGIHGTIISTQLLEDYGRWWSTNVHYTIHGTPSWTTISAQLGHAVWNHILARLIDSCPIVWGIMPLARHHLELCKTHKFITKPRSAAVQGSAGKSTATVPSQLSAFLEEHSGTILHWCFLWSRQKNRTQLTTANKLPDWLPWTRDGCHRILTQKRWPSFNHYLIAPTSGVDPNKII